jgi:hypothetical protein
MGYTPDDLRYIGPLVEANTFFLYPRPYRLILPTTSPHNQTHRLTPSSLQSCTLSPDLAFPRPLSFRSGESSESEANSRNPQNSDRFSDLPSFLFTLIP